MFGSDWPVCTLAADYEDVLALAESATGHLTAGERAAVFGETAGAGVRDRGVTGPAGTRMRRPDAASGFRQPGPAPRPRIEARR